MSILSKRLESLERAALDCLCGYPKRVELVFADDPMPPPCPLCHRVPTTILIEEMLVQAAANPKEPLQYG